MAMHDDFVDPSNVATESHSASMALGYNHPPDFFARGKMGKICFSPSVEIDTPSRLPTINGVLSAAATPRFT